MPASIPPPSPTISPAHSPVNLPGPSSAPHSAPNQVPISSRTREVFDAYNKGKDAALRSLEYARFSEKHVSDWKREMEAHHSDKTLSNLTETLKKFVAEAERRSCKRICLFTEHGAVLLKRKGTGAHMYYSPDLPNESVKLAVHSVITEDLTMEILRCLYEQNTISNIVGPHSDGKVLEDPENYPPSEGDGPPPPYTPGPGSTDTSQAASILGEELDLSSLPEVPNFPLDDGAAVPEPESAAIPELDAAENPGEMLFYEVGLPNNSVDMQTAVENLMPFPPRPPVEMPPAPARQFSFPVIPVSPRPQTLPMQYGEAANEPQMVPGVQQEGDSPVSMSPETSFPSFLRSRFESVQPEPTKEELQKLREELKLVIQGDKKITLEREIEKLSNLKASIEAEQYLPHHQGKMHRLIENQSNLRALIVDLLNGDEVDETRHVVLMKQILKIGINNYRNMKNIKSEINKISDENKIEMEGKNYAVRDENGFAIVRKTAKKLDDRNLELSNEIARNRLPSPKRST